MAGVVPLSRRKGKDDSVVEADVLIVGTGLTGCLTAAALARRGVKVVQIDRHGIYGGAYKSVKLSELCKWVNAEGQEPYSNLKCRSSVVTPTQVAASAASATAAATGAASLAADVAPVEKVKGVKAEAAVGAGGGDAAAAVISPATSALAQAAASLSEAAVPATDQPPPASARTAAGGGTEMLEQQRATKKPQVDISNVSVASTGDLVFREQVSSPYALSAAPLVEAEAGSADGTAYRRWPEWVCAFEENASGVSFCLRREWQEAAATSEQSTTAGRPNTVGEGNRQERDSSSPVEGTVPPQDSGRTRTAAWGDSESIFFSSRWFSFFPFAIGGKGDPVTERCSSIKTVNSSFKKKVPLCPGKNESECVDGEETANAIAAGVCDERREWSLASVAPDAAEARKAAPVDDFVAPKQGGKTRSETAFTERLPERAVPSSGPAFVRDATTSTKGGCAVVPPVEDQEALKKKLLKSNRFSIDLVPRVLYSNSAITQILVTCGAAKYMEFRPIDTPVYVGELEADVPGIQEQASGGFRRGASKEAAALQESQTRRQLLSARSQGKNEVEKGAGKEEEEGVKDGQGSSEEEMKNDDDDASKEELSLVQMPLTRSAIFSSSLLSVQEKRLLMKFISNVAAPKLNNQFLSAARLWTADKQAVTSAFGGNRTSTAAPAAAASRATPPAQTAAASGAAGTRGQAKGKGTSFREAGNDALVSNKNNLSNFFEQNPTSSDGAREDMTWEEYLEHHQLTDKLQRYLSYGVCVSDFPLRSRASVHGECQRTSLAPVAKTCGTRGEEASEGDERRETKRRREDDNGRVTMRQPMDEDETCGRNHTGGSWSASEGHARLIAFVQSVGLYENHLGAWLYPLYGTGDLPQALARAASLSGAVYMLHAGLVELKIICRPSSSFALASQFPHRAPCSMQAASSCTSSPLFTEFEELQTTLSGDEKGARIWSCAGDNTTASKAKSSDGEPAFQEEYSRYDESAFFLSKFHTAMANAEALEAKLETGVTVRTRLLLFEADALPPLYQRVRTRMASAALAQAREGYVPELKSSFHVVNRAPPVRAPAQRGEASTVSGSKASPEHPACAPKELSNDAKADVDVVKETMGACNESPRALSNTAGAPRHAAHAGKALQETPCARGTNVHSPVYLGELLFPVLRFRATRAPASYAVSTKRKRDQRGTEGEDTTESTERKEAAEEEELFPPDDSPKGEALCAEGYHEKCHICAVDKHCPVNVPQTGGGESLSQTAQQRKKTFDERLPTYSAPRSFGDYYTQASCHLIALCGKSVLDGPGFRMCVCSVRPNRTSAFHNSSRVRRNGPHASTVNPASFSGRSSAVTPGSVARESARRRGANVAQAIASSAALGATGWGTREDTSGTRRDGSTGVSAAPGTGIAEFTSLAPSTADASNGTPARGRLPVPGDSPLSASVTVRATKCTCSKPRRGGGAPKCTCTSGQTRLLSEENTPGGAGKACLAACRHTVDGSSSPGARGVVSALSESNVVLRKTNADRTSHSGATTAWPVLVLQTDGTCGTAPADYVLLHLSHIDGPGVDACGCNFHGIPPRRCGELKVKDASTENHESCAEEYAGAAGTAEDFNVCDRIQNVTGRQRDAPAVESSPISAASPTDGAGVKKTAPSESEAVHACCNKTESRPCTMLVYVLRRLLERGRRREAAAQDCVFACGYVLHTLRSDIEKRLQGWQLGRFRGAVRRSGEKHEVAGQAKPCHASAGKQHSSKEETNSAVLDIHAAGPAFAGDVQGAADAAEASTAVALSADGSIADVSQQRPIPEGKVPTTSSSFPQSKTPRSRATRQNHYRHAAEEIVLSSHLSVEKDNRVSSLIIEQCGCLSLPALPSTPLSFLLQEPHACQQVLEVLLDQRINIGDLVPAHVCQQAEEAAQELLRLSAPYEKLSEIVAAVP